MTMITEAAWPATSTVAHLVWGLRRLPARVLRCKDDLLTLAVVLPKGSRQMPRPGGTLRVQWADLRGLHERPVTVISLQGGLVHLAPTGEVASMQRRQFFRAPVTVNMRLVSGKHELEGATLDLSEGGARATVEGDTLLPAGQVMAVFTINGEKHAVPAEVVRHVAHGRQAEVSLKFGELPLNVANHIRRNVFIAQVEARRNER